MYARIILELNKSNINLRGNVKMYKVNVSEIQRKNNQPYGDGYSNQIISQEEIAEMTAKGYDLFEHVDCNNQHIKFEWTRRG